MTETEIKISEWELINQYISKITDYREYNSVLKQFKKIAFVANQLPIGRDKMLFLMKWRNNQNG